MKKYMKKITTVFTSAILISSLFVGSSSVVEAQEVDLNETLIIYTNSASGGRGEWITEKAREEGFNIQMVEMGGGELTERIIAEKNNPIADMIFGISSLDANKLKSQEILLNFKPEWIDKIDQSLADVDGFYAPVVSQPLILIGGPDVEEMPSDWTELGTTYPGQYAINPLSGGTPRLILASIAIRYADESGELGVSEEGWLEIENYVSNAYILSSGESGIVKMLDEADPVTFSMMWGSGALQGQVEFESDFKVMTPEVGIPVVTEQTMIINGSSRAELAKMFINWFGQAEIQVEYAKEFGVMPANIDAASELPESTQKLLDQVKPQEIDWDYVGKYLDQWVEKAELEFVQ